MSNQDGAEGAGSAGAEDGNKGGTAQGGQGGQFRIVSQYVKDQSFESPNAPQSLGTGLPQPAIDIIVDVIPRKFGEGQYEIALQLTAKATRGENVAFIAELLYAGLFSISNIPDEHLQPLLLIEAPRFLFPFARRVMSDMTRDGGFPPLALDYMDFESLYRQRLAQQSEESGAQGEAPKAAAQAEEN